MNNLISAAAVGTYAPKHSQARTNKKLVRKSSDSEFPLIHTGPLAGRPKRPPQDRKRFLIPEQIGNLANAFFFSETLPSGYRLTSGVTLHMRLASFKDPTADEGDAAYPRVLTAILHRIGRKMADAGRELAYLYVWENGRKKGVHVHIMTNVPVTMLGAVRKMLATNYGLTAPYGVRFSLGGRKSSHGPDTGYGMRKPAMREGFFKYLLKGYNPAEFRYFAAEQQFLGQRLGLSYTNPGAIPWKRVGASENLGTKARSLAGWREIRDIDEIASRLHQHSDTSARGGKAQGRKKDAAARMPPGSPLERRTVASSFTEGRGGRRRPKGYAARGT